MKDIIKVEYRTPVDDNDSVVLRGDIFLNGAEIASLAVSHQTYQDGWDMKNTGNMEISLSLVDSEEFDIIGARPCNSKQVDESFAKQCILETVGAAIKVYHASMEVFK